VHIPLTHPVPSATTRSLCCTSAGHIAEAETEPKISAATRHRADFLERPLEKTNSLDRCATRSAKRRSLPSAMLQLRAAIATRLERGETLDAVERELIARSELPEEQRHALWLYAWSHPNRPAAAAPGLSVWAALGNALLILVGIYRY
jgi:hypothetical protein